MFSSPPVSKEYLDSCQGPYCNGGQYWGGLLYSLPLLPCHLCGTNRQGFISLSHGARTTLRSANSSASAVVEHAISSGHTIASDEVSVIDFNLQLYPQRALEAWHTRSQPHPLNQECGNFSSAYDWLWFQNDFLANTDIRLPNSLSCTILGWMKLLFSYQFICVVFRDLSQPPQSTSCWKCTLLSISLIKLTSK